MAKETKAVCKTVNGVLVGTNGAEFTDKTGHIWEVSADVAGVVWDLVSGMSGYDVHARIYHSRAKGKSWCLRLSTRGVVNVDGSGTFGKILLEVDYKTLDEAALAFAVWRLGATAGSDGSIKTGAL
jgi:hypothetical protein